MQQRRLSTTLARARFRAEQSRTHTNRRKLCPQWRVTTAAHSRTHTQHASCDISLNGVLDPTMATTYFASLASMSCAHM